jgi:hypothetical protein
VSVVTDEGHGFGPYKTSLSVPIGSEQAGTAARGDEFTAASSRGTYYAVFGAAEKSETAIYPFTTCGIGAGSPEAVRTP